MKKKLVFITILLVVLGGATFLFLRNRQSSNSQNDQADSSITVTTIEYFLPVTKFKSYGDNLSMSEMVKMELFVLKKYENDYIESGNSSDVEFVETVDGLYEKLNSVENSVGFVKLEDLDVRFKYLKIDNFDYFAKDFDSKNYPLKYESKEEMSKSEFDERYPNAESVSDEITIDEYSRGSLTKFFGAGEIITGRGVDIKWLQLSNNNFEFLFDRVKSEIQESDLAIALLEHSYNGNPTPCPLCTSFVGDEALIPQIKDVGIDILSLAGNHLGDGGVAAELRTRVLLDNNEIDYFGAGDNLEKASEPKVVEVNGLKYAFLGADDIATYDWATTTAPGANRFLGLDGEIDSEKIKADIQKAKSMADKVIIYMSWGVEYTNVATEHQQEMAHEMIDAGADLIISSHVHWIQNMEIYKDKLIVYGFGNFIFDQTHTDPTRESIYVNFNFLSGNLINIEVVPMLACGYHFGAKNLAFDVIDGKLSYDQVDAKNEAQECVWLQPKPLTKEHPKYKVIMDRLFEYTEF